MVQKCVFGLHTAEFKKWISIKEYNLIKAYFNLNSDKEQVGSTYFYQNGLTKFWIKKISGKSKPRYYLHVIVNFARTLGIGNFKIMPYTTVNIRKVFTNINKILKALPLSNENRKFQDWTIVRFDSVFDIFEKHTELLMLLLNQSLNLGNKKKRCKRIPIQGKTTEESINQSMRFGNHSFIYNIYRKMEEILDKGKTITEKEKEEVQYLLRIERQNHENAVKKLLSNMKASDLATVKVHDTIMKTMIDEIEVFFGKGDFYSWKEIKKVYYPKHKADIDTIQNVMVQITNTSLEAKQELYTKDISDIFNKLKISPAGIKKEIVKQYNIYWMKGIYNRITEQYQRRPNKRQYNNFPIPCRTGDGRYKATITLYNAGSGVKRISVAGKTLEEYEHKVLNKLKATYLNNSQYIKSEDLDKGNMLLKSADSIIRFHKAAKTTAKQEAEEFISNFRINSKKKTSTKYL